MDLLYYLPMATHITEEGVERVARLARLQLTEAEKATAAQELESILTYMDRLAEVDTADSAPYVLPGAPFASLRPDTVEPFADRQALLDPTRFKDDTLITKGIFSDTDTHGS